MLNLKYHFSNPMFNLCIYYMFVINLDYPDSDQIHFDTQCQ